MTINGWLQIAFFLLLVFLVTKPMGVFMARVFNREKTFMDPVLRPVEHLLYRITGVDENHEMRWTEYAVAMLLFSLVSMIVLYLMQRLQGYLPFNPQKLGAVSPAHLAPEESSVTRIVRTKSARPLSVVRPDECDTFHPNHERGGIPGPLMEGETG